MPVGVRSWRVVGFAAVLLAACAGETAAQFGPRPSRSGGVGFPLAIGFRAGHDFDNDAWTVGGQLRFMLPFLRGIEILPSGDAFFSSARGPEWQVNVDAAVRTGVGFLYAGGGLAIVRDDFILDGNPTTETGYNLLVGMHVPFLRIPLRPFIEGRWTYIRGTNPFRLVAGANISLGSRSRP